MTLREYLTYSRTSFTALGAQFGITQPCVTYWMKNGVPPKHVLPVCAWASWIVTPHELRPDLYPNPTDALPNSEPRWCDYGGH